ncbi:hypothetical protein V7x_43010 [Crateriforma conspicua]|uniref:Uncharacterized protein n=1 Tax=Crateriforma conspicua TaxID=2527996 RepID=A0A5C6FQ09_9PLAN|nr:hypothetical protein [Crateriforma conspicua]TWU62566.1 hypothetical protein V7x_43010 [Crateriforma conspicua]
MTNSWDSVEKHNRRKRQRKRFRIFGIIMMLFFLLFVIGIPPIFKVDNEPQQLDNDPDERTAGPVVDAKQQQPLQPDDDRVAALDAAESAQPANDNTSDVPLEDVAPPPVESLQRSIASSVPAPEEPAPDPEQPKAAERALASLERKIERLDGDKDRLEKYGGATWNSIQTLVESAYNSDDPAIVIGTATRASDQLDALIPEIDYLELRESISGQNPRTLLASVVEFRRSHADHPRLTELEQSVKGLPREKWLEMAAQELKAAPPDDAGFSEGWLPIASAWQLVGNDAEAREAVRQAIEALPRMTLPERVIESTIEICQHESFDKGSSHQLIEDAAKMCEQIAAKWTRGTYLANLSGLASKLGHRTLAAKLLEQALSPDNMNVEFGVTEKLILTQQARAASWTAKPETIFAICAKLEKLNYPKPVYNANAYGHAAIAAARYNDRTQFFRAMLLTENALAPVRVYDYPNYLYAVRLAEANLLHRRWRAAVIVANNIPDPYVRASLLFRIMKDAPQEIRTRNLSELFERFADQRYASPACAGHAEHRIRSGETLISVAEWTQSLPLASQRAAAFAGIARSTGTTTVADDPPDEEPQAAVVFNDTESLMNAAERVAHQIQEPIDAAFVWMQIARTWNLMGKTQRYRQAIANLDDRLFDAWTGVWENRPPVKRSYNGGYIDADDRHRDDEKHTVGMIVACHRLIAEMQTDLGDARGAMESCLNLANAAGLLDATATYNNRNFLYLKSLLNRLYGETAVAPESVLLKKHRSYRYTRAQMAAWAKDIPALEAAIPELVEHYQSRKANSNERHIPARAYGELAILYAERGNVEAYRNARRSAQSQITQGRAGSEMKLILATADALAGEFALAESNLVRGTLGWYGDVNRPRKQLVISLAADGQWEKALEHARKVSKAQPLYRAEAWAAVAEGRGKGNSETDKELLAWIDSLESQVDRAAVYCGLTLAVAAGE